MKVNRVGVLFVIFILVLNNYVYAKYIYDFDEVIINLKREKTNPSCQVSYSTEEWTNENVIITITSDKEIQPVSGFVLSDDKKILTKEVSENEEGKLIINDLSGNSEEVEYSVTNIDKTMPQINIIEKEDANGLSIECDDNVGIKEVYVDKYDDELEIQSYQNYWDAYNYYGIDRTKDTLTVHITKHPENTRKYEYYLNNKLYTVSKDKKMTFTGLKNGKEYTVKVNALDKDGNILEKSELNLKTSYYSNIESSKTKNKFKAKINGLSKKVSHVKYAVWNYNYPEKVEWYDAQIIENSVSIELKNKKNQYYPFYAMHVYLYDKNEKVLDVIEFSIDFETNYEKANEEIDLNNLEKKGKYQIILKDYAKNEKIFHVKF